MRRLHSDANILTHTIRKGWNCRSVSLRQPQPFIIHHSLLLVFDQFLSIAISSEIDTSVVFSVPSEYGKLIDAEVINVRYESGIARDEARFGENTGVDYMLAKIGDIELYAELPAVDPDEDDIEEQEELLMASIKKQAREAGFNTKLLNFGKK